MTDSPQSDGREAMLTLVGLAEQEVAEVLTEFTPERAGDCRELCASHLDNVVWASSQAGLDDLYLVAESVLTRYADEKSAFDASQGTEFLGWLADLRRYLQAPAGDGEIGALLNPLPDDARAALGAILGDASTAAPAAGPTDSDAAAAPADTADAPGEFDDFAPADDDLLGMLAVELREVAPQLAGLAQTIAGADDPSAAAADYREIVERIASVAQELEFDGLLTICRFVDHNLDLVAALDPAARARSLEVLQHWPRPLIEHLLQHGDDALCIAVIDYLERDDWPEPLPYSSLRELIDGLTREVQAGGAHEIEVRALEASPEDVALEMSADASAELIDAFFDESPGHAETFSVLVAKIGAGEDIQASVEAAQRIAHTLKGSGNLVGVRGIANLAHHIEDIFDYIARQRITPPPPLANTLQEAADTLESMLEALQGLSPPPDDAQRVLQDVLDWANRIDSGKMRADDYSDADAEASAPPADAPASAPAPGENVEDRRSARTGENTPAAGADSVRVPLSLLDAIFRIVSETAITSGQIQERLNRLQVNEKMIRHNDSAMQQLRYELENLVSIRGLAARHRGSMAEGGEDFDPLEMDEYDEFYGATHAYIESVADSREILRGFGGEVGELDALFLEQQRLNKELQQMVLTTRMVPVSTIASRLQRTLRQVCRATGKQAELSIIGRDLMLDGDVLNKLADPLMHMLRNAVDHGIEAREIREASGKPPAGQVVLRFRQEGNNVAITCSDDGAGLDYARIRTIATERGLLVEGQTADEPTLANLILHSGFSTRDEITHVSGRGVGMDVVHNTIQALNGTMDIGEAPGGGTLISMRLPITLLTSHCLLVAAGESQYAIPTISLTQILSPGTGAFSRADDKLSFRLEQDTYPAHTLNALIGAADPADDALFEHCSVLLVQAADGVSAVAIERVVTSYDLVVKNLGAYIKSVSGIAGVSMLGNGQVVPVLDLGAMLQAQNNRGPAAIRAPESAGAAETELPKILIVDDSLSVRNSLSQLMRDSGYHAILARDGREAVIILETEKPDVVLTDLEMPRMNGLELVSYIRNSSAWKDLPAVMITSRNMSKHRQQAERVGVNRFIPKPFSDDEVLEAIDEQLASLA